MTATLTRIQRDLVPLAEAAMRLKMNRERVLRRLQNGTISGEKLADRWFVHRDALPPVEGPEAA